MLKNALVIPLIITSLTSLSPKIKTDDETFTQMSRMLGQAIRDNDADFFGLYLYQNKHYPRLGPLVQNTIKKIIDTDCFQFIYLLNQLNRAGDVSINLDFIDSSLLGGTPLHYACEKSSSENLLRALLESIDVNTQRHPLRKTPLMIACQQRNDAFVMVLLQAGADPSREDLNGRSALSYAITPYSHDQLLRLLPKEKKKAMCVLVDFDCFLRTDVCKMRAFTPPSTTKQGAFSTTQIEFLLGEKSSVQRIATALAGLVENFHATIVVKTYCTKEETLAFLTTAGYNAYIDEKRIRVLAPGSSVHEGTLIEEVAKSYEDVVVIDDNINVIRYVNSGDVPRNVKAVYSHKKGNAFLMQAGGLEARIKELRAPILM